MRDKGRMGKSVRGKRGGRGREGEREGEGEK